MQSGNDANVFGIDTNQFQGTENWTQIAAAKIHGVLPVRFALIRASQGLTTDTLLARNAQGATAVALHRGFYHAILPQGTNYTAANASAKAQADYFLAAVDQVQGWQGFCVNPGIDIEVNPFGLSVSLYCYWLEHFLLAFESGLSSFPLKPMLYLSPSKWQTLLGGTAAFQSYPLWVADWGVNQPQDFGGWTQWRCWQWSSPGPLAGVPGVTDYDEWQGPLPAMIAAPSPTSTSTSTSSSSSSSSSTSSPSLSPSSLSSSSSTIPAQLTAIGQSLTHTADLIQTLAKEWLT